MWQKPCHFKRPRTPCIITTPSFHSSTTDITFSTIPKRNCCYLHFCYTKVIEFHKFKLIFSKVVTSQILIFRLKIYIQNYQIKIICYANTYQKLIYPQTSDTSLTLWRQPFCNVSKGCITCLWIKSIFGKCLHSIWFLFDNFVTLNMAIDLYEGIMHHLNVLNVLNVSNNDGKWNLKV